MGIVIVDYEPAMVEHVAEFNRRILAKGAPWGFYETATPDWLPRKPGQNVWREYFLAIDGGTTVRGGYCLKPQEFLLRGDVVTIGSWQGPVSEGVVDRKYNTLALRMLQDMLKRQPLLFSWGAQEPLPQILTSLGWLIYKAPFCLKVLKPYRFLRRNRFLRTSGLPRLALDILAFSGTGWLGNLALRGIQFLRAGRRSGASAEIVASFGGWADELWKRCVDRYTMIAVRDRKTLNLLLPESGWPPAIRLRVTEGGETIGWAAVLDSQASGYVRFGSLRVGTVIDCLALPEDAHKVIGAASRFLSERGVDILCSNQSHPDWVKAFAANGYTILENRRQFSASKPLAKRLEPFEETRMGMHLTPLDSDGPHGF